MKSSILFLFLIMNVLVTSSLAQSMSSKRYELLTGVRKSRNGKAFWDKKYSKEKFVFGKKPAEFLALNYDFLPEGGSVLDMGMGEGRNAVFLARKGFSVTGVDISTVAIKKSNILAKEYGVKIKGVQASLNSYKIPDGSFDAVICFYYVDRSLHKKMVKWLKPGGILIYESYTNNQQKVRGGDIYEKKYLLRPGEVLKMFDGLRLLKYEEPLHRKNFTASAIFVKI